MCKKIFEPGYIGSMKLKNRLIVPAMSTRFVKEDGKATEKFIAYHERRAQGGWSMMITENIVIKEGVGIKTDLPGLWCDDQIESYKNLTDRIHAADGRICAQLYHAGRNTHSGITGLHNVAPSAICDPTNNEIPYELTVEQIHEIQNDFVAAAKRAKQAGFDAVELHGAHGYLIAQFLSPFSNCRGDEYGGTVANRARFAVEIVRKIKQELGSDYPLLFRISASEFIEQGMNPELAKSTCILLEEAGVDAINCSQSGPASFFNTVPSFYVPQGAFVNFAKEVKSVVSIPVITVGRINSVEMAEQVLRSGKADFVAMGRASVADPDMPLKAMENRIEDIVSCIGCCQGCLGSTRKKKSLTCLVNPAAGKESTHNFAEKAKELKNIVVAGGGISGCQAAITAAQRGHTVTLLEKDNKLGGQWNAACVPCSKAEFSSFLAWQKRRLEQLGVTVKLGVEATVENIRSENPDVVVCAIGSNAIMVPIPGLNTQNVVFAQDILLGKAQPGKHPVILGGGMVGAETAEFLASYKLPVVLIEMRSQIAADCEPGPGYFLRKNLKDHGVQILTDSAVTEISENSVSMKHNDEIQTITGIDQIILAVGRRKNDLLEQELKQAGLNVVSVGDASTAKDGFSNLQEAFLTAYDL